MKKMTSNDIKTLHEEREKRIKTGNTIDMVVNNYVGRCFFCSRAIYGDKIALINGETGYPERYTNGQEILICRKCQRKRTVEI